MEWSMVPWPSVGAGSGWLFVGLGVWAMMTGRLVPRATVDDARKERDEWKTMAMRSLGVTESMTRPVEAVADVMAKLPDPGAGPRNSR